MLLKEHRAMKHDMTIKFHNYCTNSGQKKFDNLLELSNKLHVPRVRLISISRIQSRNQYSMKQPYLLRPHSHLSCTILSCRQTIVQPRRYQTPRCPQHCLSAWHNYAVRRRLSHLSWEASARHWTLTVTGVVA